jgi:hypothetical protein
MDLFVILIAFVRLTDTTEKVLMDITVILIAFILLKNTTKKSTYIYYCYFNCIYTTYRILLKKVLTEYYYLLFLIAFYKRYLQNTITVILIAFILLTEYY